MSMMRCDRHGPWDSDNYETCPQCEQDIAYWSTRAEELFKDRHDQDVRIKELESRLATANAELTEQKKLSAAISRDCNNTALERNEYWGELARLRTAMEGKLLSKDLAHNWKDPRMAQLVEAYEKAYNEFAGPREFRHAVNFDTYNRAGLIGVWNAAMLAAQDKEGNDHGNG